MLSSPSGAVGARTRIDAGIGGVSSRISLHPRSYHRSVDRVLRPRNRDRARGAHATGRFSESGFLR